MNKPKICPLMSTPDKTVECREDCALNIEAPGYTHKCAIVQIVDAIDFNGNLLRDINIQNFSDD